MGYAQLVLVSLILFLHHIAKFVAFHLNLILKKSTNVENASQIHQNMILLEVYLTLIHTAKSLFMGLSITRTVFKDLISTSYLKMVYLYEFGNLLNRQISEKKH